MELDKFKNLTGDPVYEYLRTKVIKGNTLAGGRIYDNPSRRPTDPKVIIQVAVLIRETKKFIYPKYSYKKIERSLKEL